MTKLRTSVSAAATGAGRTRRATMTNNTFAGSRWNAEVQELELAIAQITRSRPVTNECRISFFEMTGDPDLHVNVTQESRTGPVIGWSGPAAVEGGFVHNRRFRDERGVLGRIQDVIFAAHGA
jgi:hypothetical protein